MYTIGLAQTGYPTDGDVLTQARDIVQRAVKSGCHLIVFPENFMWPRKLSPAEIASIAEPVDGPFVHAVADIMRQAGLWAAFTINERNPHGNQPYNTAVIMDDTGKVRGSYRKCHLYDALGERESSRIALGLHPAHPVETPFGAIGLQVCYDLRFPESARVLALCDCDVLIYMAAWHDGPAKAEQWETLLRARAIENELYVAGVCRAGQGYSGSSMLVDPMGRVVARASRVGDKAGDESSGVPEDLVIGEIDLDLVRSTREKMPVFSHRRPELYELLSE